MTSILDASAVLCLLQNEPGQDKVRAALRDTALINAVNWAEVAKKTVENGTFYPGLRQDLADIGLLVTDFDGHAAEAAGLLYPETKHLGLSLADRACIARALILDAPCLTTDRIWSQVEGLNVVLLR